MTAKSSRCKAFRVAGLLAIAVLAALSLGFYHRFLAEPPPPPDVKEIIDSGKPLSSDEKFEQLAKSNPVAMYEECLTRYQRETTGGFTATLVKKERVEGYPKPPENPHEEVIQLSVRGDTPDHATGKPCVEVLMKWQSGARKFLGSEIRGTVYNEKPGKDGTGGKVVTFRPDATFATTSPVPPADPLAQAQSRYCIRDAGMYRGMLRTYDAWKQRQEAGTLKTEYLGKKAIPELAGRVCYVIDRVCDAPEADAFELGMPPVTDPKIIARDGFTKVRVMIDVETWQQVGTELYRPDGNLLASYYFRNPNNKATFDADTFTVANLKKK